MGTSAPPMPLPHRIPEQATAAYYLNDVNGVKTILKTADQLSSEIK